MCGFKADDRRLNRLFLAAIVIIAFALRLVPIFLGAQPLAPAGAELTGDQVFFHVNAAGILDQPGYIGSSIPLSYRAPGYTFFLAMIYRLLGRNLLVVRIIQVLMGSSLCILVYLIGKKLFSAVVGLISALILAFNLSFIYMPATILSENLFSLIFLIALLFFVKMWQEPFSFKYRAILGVSLGLAALTRAEALLLPAFILPAMLIRAACHRQKILGPLKRFAVILLFFVLPIIPWTVRNYSVHKGFVPIAMEGGLACYISFAISDMQDFGCATNDEVEVEARKMSTEMERSRYYYRQTVKHIRENFSKLPRLTLFKAMFFWSPFNYELTFARSRYNTMFVFSLPFFILGIFSLRKKIVENAPLFVPIIYYPLIALIFQSSARFRSQVEPCIIIIASVGICYFVNKVKNRLLSCSLLFAFLSINFIIFLYSASVKVLSKNILQAIGLW